MTRSEHEHLQKCIIDPESDEVDREIRRVIATEYQRLKKTSEQILKPKTHSPNAYYEERGALSKRRAQATARTAVVLQKKYPDVPLNDWFALNAHCMTYTQLEADDHILFAAAIWILECLAEEGVSFDQIAPLLPDPKKLKNMPILDAEDRCFDKRLIQSVEYIIRFRDQDIAPLECVGKGLYRVLTSELAAKRQDNADVPSKRRLKKLLSLIPQGRVNLAVHHFEKLFDQWCDRFFQCYRSILDDEKRLKEKMTPILIQYEKHSHIVQRSRSEFIKRMNRQKRYAMRRIHKYGDRNVAGNVSDMIDDLFGSASLEQDALVIDSLSARGEAQEAVLEKLLAEYMDHISNKYEFMVLLQSNGILSADVCEARFNKAVASAMKPLEITDPFAVCFALVYLIEDHSDLPWVYAAGVGMMKEVAMHLPWKHQQHEDRGGAINWFDLRFRSIDSGELYDLSQIIFEGYGIIMPRRSCTCKVKASSCPDLSHTIFPIRSDEAFSPIGSYASEYASYLNEIESNVRSDKEYDALMKTIRQQDEMLKQLRAQLHRAEKEKAEVQWKYDMLQKASQAEHQELADLRTIVFHENDPNTEDSPAKDHSLPYSVRSAIIIFGGHDSFLKTIRTMLDGNVRYLRHEAFDTRIVRSADILWIQTNAISHSLYNKVVDVGRKYGKQIRYFHYASAAQCVEQIKEQDQRLDNN